MYTRLNLLLLLLFFQNTIKTAESLDCIVKTVGTLALFGTARTVAHCYLRERKIVHPIFLVPATCACTVMSQFVVCVASVDLLYSRDLSAKEYFSWLFGCKRRIIGRGDDRGARRNQQILLKNIDKYGSLYAITGLVVSASMFYTSLFWLSQFTNLYL